MLKNLKNKKKKGFTLIELIIVIAIIAILAAIAIPKFGDIRRDAALKSDIANAKTIANAATILLTEGELTGPIIVDATVDADNEIENYLQNPSAPKTKEYTEFVVDINGDTVTVSMQNDTEKLELFPVAASEATNVE